MRTLEDAVTKFTGQPPTDREKQAWYRAADALGLKTNDALWLLLIVLGYYETLYEKIPGLIAEATKEAVGRARGAAEAELKAAAAKAEAMLAETVARTAHDIAERTASAKRWQWIAVCVSVTSLAFVSVGTWGYRTGSRTGDRAGYARGYSEARDEKAAAAWANTPEGQLAFGLAKAGSIRHLATCGDRRWRQERGNCFPVDDKGSVYGWRLPEEATRRPSSVVVRR